MNRRILVSVVWAVAGFAVAVGVMAWAFALAGQEISEPATPPIFSLSPTPDDVSDRSPSPSDDTPTASPSERLGDDNSGPGAGSDDDSGPGSDDSGGSDNSGPGSSSSGSGSNDSSDLDDD